MRCPKCGYISFDHVETCLKCKKDISGKVDVNGTTYHVAAPSFLKVSQNDMAEEESGFDESDSEQVESNIEFSDPDLDVLAGDGGDDDFAAEADEDEENISFDGFESDDVAAEFQLESEDDFEIDAEDDGSFEFEFEDDDQGDEQLDTADLDMPDELSDISDLAPPVPDSGKASAGEENVTLSLDDDTSVAEDSNLDGLDFNLGVGDDDGDLSLSLDDIDLSEDELSGSGNDEIDGLSMDLDLGGLDDDEDSSTKDKKSSGGLDDIDFSLD